MSTNEEILDAFQKNASDIAQLEYVASELNRRIDKYEAENEKLKDELEVHRWIPVGERLPEERNDPAPYRSEDVLVHSEGVVRRAFYLTRRKCWTYYHAAQQAPVTHWKPIILPE